MFDELNLSNEDINYKTSNPNETVPNMNEYKKPITLIDTPKI